MEWKIWLTFFQAVSDPPAIIAGPFLAPLGPPETPIPKKLIFFLSKRLYLSIDFEYNEFPKSAIISPGFINSIMSSIHSSILFAGRLSIIILGLGVSLISCFKDLTKNKLGTLSCSIFFIIVIFFS